MKLAQSGMNKTIKSVSELIDAGLIDENHNALLEEVAKNFSVSISPNIQNIISNDAIARQYVPSINELDFKDYELIDPIGDVIRSPLKGLVHRYHNRVLIKLIEICPVYCRFCFRRENVGDKNGGALKADEINAALEYVQNHPEINEIIFTGGDPLLVSPRRISDILGKIANIKTVKFIRFHTRIPVASPELISDELLDALKSAKQSVKIVIHINHAAEINENAQNAINAIKGIGIMLYSQSVLLRGVNDSPEILADLMNELLANNVTPYYLHHPDLAKGTGHFQIDFEEGMKIYNALAKLVSGIALPKYVIDIPNGFGKVPVDNAYVKRLENGDYSITDRDGNKHHYPNIKK